MEHRAIDTAQSPVVIQQSNMTLDQHIHAVLLPLPEMTDAAEEALIAQLTREYEQAEQIAEEQAKQEAHAQWVVLMAKMDAPNLTDEQEEILCTQIDAIEDTIDDDERDAWIDAL